jgi:hypothetical protein
MSIYTADRGDDERLVIDRVLDWKRGAAFRFLASIKRTPIGKKIKDYQIVDLENTGHMREFLREQGATGVPGLQMIQRAALAGFDDLARRGKTGRRRLYRSFDDMQTDREHGRIRENGAFLLELDGAPLLIYLDFTFNGSYEVDHCFVFYRDLAQIKMFHDAYDKYAKKFVDNPDIILNLDGTMFPKPKVDMDTVVIPDAMKADLLANTLGFFRTKAAYDSLGLPWKRGILLLGPPGTGKTYFLKALSNIIKLPFCVLRITTNMNDGRLREQFQRAVDMAPCVVIIEDLDRAREPYFNLSTLLNILDGLEEADGLLTIATSNHPEHIDPALLLRPSRFDRKFEFGLPDVADRERLLIQLGKGKFKDTEIKAVVGRSNEFSSAMIREIVVSALTRAAIENRDVQDNDLMWACNILRDEMEKAKVGFEKRKKIGLTNEDGKDGKGPQPSFTAVPTGGDDENPWDN